MIKLKIVNKIQTRFGVIYFNVRDREKKRVLPSHIPMLVTTANETQVMTIFVVFVIYNNCMSRKVI